MRFTTKRGLGFGLRSRLGIDGDAKTSTARSSPISVGTDSEEIYKRQEKQQQENAKSGRGSEKRTTTKKKVMSSEPARSKRVIRRKIESKKSHKDGEIKKLLVLEIDSTSPPCHKRGEFAKHLETTDCNVLPDC